jgi:hypothetical protein
VSALVRREALIEGSFRYWLLRDWSGRPLQVGYGPLKFGVLWVMLNPSVADERRDDPTIRKCVGFTKRMGLDSFVVVNLYAFRATDPGELRTASARGQDIVGPRNDEMIKALADQASVIICAWGAYDGIDLAPRVAHVTASIKSAQDGRFASSLKALGLTKAGAPRHPLMMPYYAATDLTPWPAPANGGDTPRPEGLTSAAAAQLRTNTHPEQASTLGDGGPR